MPAPKVILAGSGMCNGGRIVHHLKWNLDNPKNHLLIIGYQARGSLGRRLLDGEKRVRAAGQEVNVRARVSAIGAYSSHADQPKLLHWAKMMASPRPQEIFVVHGEERQAMMVVDGLKQKLNIQGVIPEEGKGIEI